MYLVLFVYILTLVFLYDFFSKKNGFNINYIICCIVLILVAGFRYRIGFDTINYMEHFKFIPTISEFINGKEFNGDILWGYIQVISKSIYNDFFIVQIIQAVIVNVAVFWFIKRHSPKPFLGILLYYLLQWWNFCFEGMRESIAIAFFLFALDAIIAKNSIKRYYLRVWPAFFAHTFGFITLLFPFIKYIKFNKYTILCTLAVVCFSFLISDFVNSVLIYIETISGVAAEKTMKYLEDDIYGMNTLSFNGIISILLGYVLPPLYIVYVLYKNKEGHYNHIIPFVLIFAIIAILRINMTIFYRFLNYFEIPVIVAFTQSICIVKNKVRSILYFLMFCMVFIRFNMLLTPFIGNEVKTYHRYVPYNSIFEKKYNKNSELIFNSF